VPASELLRRYRTPLFVVAAIVVAIVILRWTVFAPAPVPVDVATVERGTVESTVTNSRAGTVKARRRAKLSPQEGGRVIALLVAENEEQSVLTATENGYGKRTPIAEYTRHGRGTQGMIAIQTSERNGKVVAATLASPDDEIMLITSGGVLIRTRVNEIREMGRSTQGVTLINLSEGEKLSGMQRIMDRDDDNGENGGNGTNGGTHGTNGANGGAEGTIAPEGEGGEPTTH